MRRILIILASLVAALAITSAAAASIRVAGFTGHVAAGDYASITVKVSPRAHCAITVVYDTVVSHARGLGAKTGSSITWQWRVGTSTHAGRWPVTVDCGKSGRLTRTLVVR